MKGHQKVSSNLLSKVMVLSNLPNLLLPYPIKNLTNSSKALRLGHHAILFGMTSFCYCIT